jgi:hypothetical protein
MDACNICGQISPDVLEPDDSVYVNEVSVEPSKILQDVSNTTTQVVSSTIPQVVTSTIPDFAYCRGSGHKMNIFCTCTTPSYVHAAPPFCFSTSTAMLHGTYKCVSCSATAFLPTHGAYVDPYYSEN